MEIIEKGAWSLPHELWTQIIRDVSLIDLVAVASTCCTLLSVVDTLWQLSIDNKTLPSQWTLLTRGTSQIHPHNFKQPPFRRVEEFCIFSKKIRMRSTFSLEPFMKRLIYKKWWGYTYDDKPGPIWYGPKIVYETHRTLVLREDFTFDFEDRVVKKSRNPSDDSMIKEVTRLKEIKGKWAFGFTHLEPVECLTKRGKHVRRFEERPLDKPVVLLFPSKPCEHTGMPFMYIISLTNEKEIFCWPLGKQYPVGPMAACYNPTY